MRALLIAVAVLLSGNQSRANDQFKQGEQLYKEQCAVCHGDDGKKGAGYETPIWGKGTGIQKYVNAKGLFDYVQLLMPFDDPTKMTDQQKWAVVQYMLANHGSLKSDEALDAGKAAGIAIK